jgi:hypothetical protein
MQLIFVQGSLLIASPQKLCTTWYLIALIQRYTKVSAAADPSACVRWLKSVCNIKTEIYFLNLQESAVILLSNWKSSVKVSSI